MSAPPPAPEDFREVVLLAARRARVGIQTHPVAAFAVMVATDFGAHHLLFARIAFALSALAALLRWLGARRILQRGQAGPRQFFWCIAVPTAAANLIWSAIATSMLISDGITFATLIVLLGTIALAFGCAMSYAPLRSLNLTLLTLHLLPPFLAVLPRPGGEATLLALLFIAFALYILRASASLHSDYWDAVATRNRLSEARAKAEQANLAKDQFLANISHEIRTPLNGIAAPAEMLQGTALNSEQQLYADLISSSSRVLAQLIDDLLDFSKIEAGKLEIRREPFDCAALLREVASRHDLAARNKGLELSVALPQESGMWLAGDALRIGQVVDNLLSNAVKFTETGSIRLEATFTPNDGAVDVRIGVIDTGPGMKPELQQQIFKPFVQADASASRRFAGTGLGLSICKRLAQLMGGDLSFDSADGCGTHFLFALRLPQAAPRATPADSAPQHRFIGLRVLVAEDNAVNQQVIQRQLLHLDIAPHIVDDGTAALKAALSRNYDVIILDCQMPGLDGYETARRLREQGGSLAAVPIIALTANAMASDRQRALAAGMNDYLSKPVTLQTLAAMLTKWTAALPRQ